MSIKAQPYFKEPNHLPPNSLSVMGKNPVGNVFPQNMSTETKESNHTANLFAAIEKKCKYKPLRAHHFHHKSQMDALAHSNQLPETASTELTSCYSNIHLNKSRAISDASLPKILVKHAMKSNGHPRKLPAKSLEVSNISKTPNLPKLAQNLQSELNNLGNRQSDSYSAEPLAGEMGRKKRDLQFFTIKPLGQSKHYRYATERHQPISVHPHSDIYAIKNSILEQESRFETEKSKELSPIKLTHRQILDNMNDDELTDSKFLDSADHSVDIMTINTNNIYKQRALLKNPTVSQIKYETLRYKASPGKKKEFEISPVLSVRKKLDI